MKIRTYKVFLCLFFLAIFISKMIIALMPVLLSASNKNVNAVIMQLEQDSKNEKEDPDKSGIKEKKFFDENCEYSNQAIPAPLIIKKRTLLKNVTGFYQQSHHLSVLTPPPDACLAQA
jgi:hypothetical protein